LSLLFAVLISTVNFQFDVCAKVRCTRSYRPIISNPSLKTRGIRHRLMPLVRMVKNGVAQYQEFSAIERFTL
ncbi:hypothetical protein Q5692_27670, partial [Microcoleus sp. C2C3]|uniref:hypothetical protein n=1 Tax=unclassified Microcoleus TaxID=2642155 RepID=UPI002FD24F2D